MVNKDIRNNATNENRTQTENMTQNAKPVNSQVLDCLQMRSVLWIGGNMWSCCQTAVGHCLWFYPDIAENMGRFGQTSTDSFKTGCIKCFWRNPELCKWTEMPCLLLDQQIRTKSYVVNQPDLDLIGLVWSDELTVICRKRRCRYNAVASVW